MAQTRSPPTAMASPGIKSGRYSSDYALQRRNSRQSELSRSLRGPMTYRPQTIQIFLPNGDPRGIRMAEITTRIVQAIDVPRSRLADFLAMDESERMSLYFLIGEQEDGAGTQIYIGQSGDVRSRLHAHNKEKDFWQRAPSSSRRRRKASPPLTYSTLRICSFKRQKMPVAT